MSALSPPVVEACRVAAERSLLEPALVCAVIAVESGGQPVEAADGHTPTVLPEPAKFFQYLRPEKRARAVTLRLASERPLAQSEYSEFASNSHDRLRRLAEMVAYDEDAAYRACSWGLPQILGDNCGIVGFGTARAMVEAFRVGGVVAQVDAMLRYCDSRGATDALRTRDWERFASLYNGKAWRRYDYARRLASAYAEWHVRLASGDTDDRAAPEGALKLGSRGDDVRHVQQALAAAGYPVRVDGVYGPKVQGAVAAFQLQHGLPADGMVGPITRHVLLDATPVPQGAREVATVDSMARTNPVVGAARWIKRGAAGLIGGSVLEGGGSPIEKAESALWRVRSLRYTWDELLETAVSAWGSAPGLASVVVKAAHEPVVWAAIIGLSGLWLLAHRIQGHALSAEQSGAVV